MMFWVKNNEDKEKDKFPYSVVFMDGDKKKVINAMSDCPLSALIKVYEKFLFDNIIEKEKILQEEL